MALLSLSAKKAGVFLRHFTAREKHSITSACRTQEDTHYLSVLLGSLDIKSATSHLLLLLTVRP